MSSHLLRQLYQNDFEQAAGIFSSVFPVKYNIQFIDVWRGRTEHLSIGTFTSKGEMTGFLLTKAYGVGAATTQQQIEFLGVKPSCQKEGIGTILLRHILDYCLRTRTRATLIPVNDTRIIQWYKKHGFIESGEPFISSYTGDVEQTMEFVASK